MPHINRTNAQVAGCIWAFETRGCGACVCNPCGVDTHTRALCPFASHKKEEWKSGYISYTESYLESNEQKVGSFLLLSSTPHIFSFDSYRLIVVFIAKVFTSFFVILLFNLFDSFCDGTAVFYFLFSRLHPFLSMRWRFVFFVATSNLCGQKFSH